MLSHVTQYDLEHALRPHHGNSPAQISREGISDTRPLLAIAMDPPTLDRSEILARFDRLLDSHELLYTPSTSVETLTDNNFAVRMTKLGIVLATTTEPLETGKLTRPTQP